MKTFTYFAPHKTALTVSLIFAIGSLFFILPMVAMFSFMPTTDQNGNPVEMQLPYLMFLAMPIMYFIFGYLSTAFFAWLYNRVAKYTGGITFEVSE